MPKTLPTLCGIMLLLSLVACGERATETRVPKNPKAPDKEEVRGVSIWDRISTRNEPRRAAPAATLMSMGESFVYLDSFAIDSAYKNTRFIKVRLSDSTEVWAYGFATVLDAKPGVITGEVPLYMRPDLLTITPKNMEAMEIVAVVEQWDDWIKVVNEKKARTGWIKKENLSYTTIDIAFALLVKRCLEEEDQEQRIRELEELLGNNPFPNTILITELKKLIEKEREQLRESREEWQNEHRQKENDWRRGKN